MKALIWFAGLLIIAIINTIANGILKSSGIILGGLPTGLMVFGEFFLAYWIIGKLCDKWDRRRVKNDALKANMPIIEFIKSDVPAIVLETCETLRGNKKQLTEYLLKCEKARMVKDRYIDYLIEEYMALDHPSTSSAENNDIPS